MNELFSYIVQSGINLGILFGMYWFFLRGDTFYKVHRYYLLLAILISMIIPFVKISVPSGSNMGMIYLLEPIVISPERVATGIEERMNIGQFLILIYVTGSLFFLGRLIFQLIRTIVLIKQHGITEYRGVRVVITDKQYVPFSLFNLVFINRSVFTDPALNRIIEHEKVHVKQKHTWDLVIIEIVRIVQWFNPVIWLYRKNLISLHEYLADESVLSNGYKVLEYQQLLLTQTFNVQFSTLSNNLNHSLIKKRFIMMSKEKTNRISMLKMVFVVPAAIIFTFIFTLTFTENILAQVDQQTSTTVEKTESSGSALAQNQKEEPIFTVVEQMPQFPGGKEAQIKYMVNSIKYPENARKNGISGKVYVTYVIEKSGKVTDVRVLKGVDEELDKEAVRVISEMPKWKPGMEKGKPVRVQITQPIDYKLDTNKKEDEVKENEQRYHDIKK